MFAAATTHLAAAGICYDLRSRAEPRIRRYWEAFQDTAVCPLNVAITLAGLDRAIPSNGQITTVFTPTANLHMLTGVEVETECWRYGSWGYTRWYSPTTIGMTL